MWHMCDFSLREAESHLDSGRGCLKQTVEQNTCEGLNTTTRRNKEPVATRTPITGRDEPRQDKSESALRAGIITAPLREKSTEPPASAVCKLSDGVTMALCSLLHVLVLLFFLCAPAMSQNDSCKFFSFFSFTMEPNSMQKQFFFLCSVL